ncbi:hypothetical protein JXA85_00950 [Candidatus Woesearchaeota archaeon]|nr:hypothetical protein [Candidatus Woesearchaeota archaeon]
MKEGNKSRKGNRVLIARLLLFSAVFLLMSLSIGAAPSGPDVISQYTEEAPAQPATNITTAGGTITTIVLNATTQNPHWKAYVGNITGRLALRDSTNYTIYDWGVTTPTGEVYVTRNDSISWVNITCANSTHVATEETAMNHTATAPDSISNTFSKHNHSSFYTGSISFAKDQCNFTTNTYVNSTNQSTAFQEVLLYDGNSMVYTTIVEDNKYGFDFGLYDFQLIVAEKGWEGPVTSTPYYFYVELV